ncbi:MAG: helix-turn-helix domain-containing protein [Hylemonella sp.]|nr:helix-turn-helix domain-containing protein [Hylemonella sp.]
MSDEVVGSSVPVTDTPAVEPAAAVLQTTAGQLLRHAREAAGIELSPLAMSLKVSVKKLEALEADRFDQLPDAVFVRALASSVCRALKIDAAPVLALLPQSGVPRLDYDESGLNTPFHTPGDVAKTPFLDRLSRPMVLAALAVLLGALVLIFFPSTEQRAEIGAIVTRAPGPASPPAEPAPEPVMAAAPALTPTPAPAPVPAKAVAPVREASPAPVAPPPAPPVKVAKATEVAAPAARVETPVAAPAPVAAVTPETSAVRKKLASSGVVIFKTSNPSWIEVTDGKGAIQLSRLVEPGEPVGASGPLPLNVTIGRADVTEVLVRGKPFPLADVTRGGVARFEVK